MRAVLLPRLRPSAARFAARALATLPPYRLMPMPRLSPSMTLGTLQRWAIAEGDEIDDMESACEVWLDTLTDDPEDGDFVLEIEVHEVGYCARLLLQPGQTAAPDEAIAVIVEEREHVAAFASFATDLRPVVEPGTFAWQAYLKSGQERSCSNSK